MVGVGPKGLGQLLMGACNAGRSAGCTASRQCQLHEQMLLNTQLAPSSLRQPGTDFVELELTILTPASVTLSPRSPHACPQPQLLCADTFIQALT